MFREVASVKAFLSDRDFPLTDFFQPFGVNNYDPKEVITLACLDQVKQGDLPCYFTLDK